MRQRMFGWAAVLVLGLGVFGVATATAQSATDDPAQVEAGRAVFEANCAGCHSTDGTGSSTGRPLTDIASEQPDRLVHIDSVTNGKGNMPAWGESLSAEEIDAAVSYVRLTFVSQPAEPDAELAVTGIDFGWYVALGAMMLAAGAAVVLWSRRLDST